MKVENNLDTDKVRGLVWRLAFPSMLAQFVNVLYSIVDRMYIGNIEGIGALALAGVGICGPVVTLWDRRMRGPPPRWWQTVLRF